MEGFRGGGFDGATRDVREEAGAEEDGENGKILGRVVDSDVLVSRAERVLDVRAKIVREDHDDNQLECALR